jgi:regulatory protein
MPDEVVPGEVTSGEYASARRASRGRARGGRKSGRPPAGASGLAAQRGGNGEGAAPAEQAEPGKTGEGAASADPAVRARQICLLLLTLAPRTRAELAGALRGRGIPAAAADEVLERFADVGLIDDAAFARAWVESRHYSRGLAGRALTMELKRRGVEDEEIREAVAGLGPDAEAATAKRLVEQKLASTAGLPPEARTRRLAGMLARKGYPPGLAFRVIREAMEAEGADTALGEALGEALEEEPPFEEPDEDTDFAAD